MTAVQTQTYPQNDIDFNCGVCVDQFTSEADLWKHMDVEHDIRKQEKSTTFNCEFCEQIYENNNDLMNHKRDKHQLMAKPCKYFARGICHFNAKSCWFSHKPETSDRSPTINEITCKFCGENFHRKNYLMKHRKIKHEIHIATCREQIKGNCKYDDDCWYKHSKPEHNKPSENIDKIETNKNKQEMIIRMDIN